jgi:hypothetical protein
MWRTEKNSSDLHGPMKDLFPNKTWRYIMKTSGSFDIRTRYGDQIV